MTGHVKEAQDVRVAGARRTTIPYVKVGARCGRCKKKVTTFKIGHTAMERLLPGAMGIGDDGSTVRLDVDHFAMKCRRVGCPGIWCLTGAEIRNIVRPAAVAGDHWVTIPY
jgi:hypothetical protein